MRLTPEQRAERDALVFAQKESGSSYDEIYIDGVKLAKSSASAAYWRHVATLRIGKETDAIAPEFVKVDAAQANPAYQPVRDIIADAIEAAQWANETVKNLEERSTTPSPVIGMGAYAATGDSEAVIRTEAPQVAQKVLQPDQKKGDGFGKFVTVTMVIVSVAIALVTVWDFSQVLEMFMPKLPARVLSFAMEAGFWGSLAGMYRDGGEYDSGITANYSYLNWTLIMFRLFSNAVGMFYFAYSEGTHIEQIFFTLPIGKLGSGILASLISILLTLFDVSIARITIKRL